MSTEDEVMDAEAARLLQTIVGDSPLTSSREGSDDGCFFCGADTNYTPSAWDTKAVEWAVHGATCPWVLGRRLFDYDLGDHRVEGETA